MIRLLHVGATVRCTDQMIVKGIQYLIDETGLEIEDNHYEPLLDAPSPDFKLDWTPTHIVVNGTPFLWDGMQSSQKVKNVQSLRQRYPQAKIMFCGIGACFPIHPTKSYLITKRLHDQRNELTIFDNATIIARDFKTTCFFLYQATELPCPAYYAPRAFSSLTDSLFSIDIRFEPLVVWYDPRIGISASEWKDESTFKNYIQIFLDFLLKHPEARVISILKEEVTSGEELLGIAVTHIDDVEEAYLYLLNAGPILSGRVHLAIPAHAMGKPVTLIPVDTRAEAFQEYTPNELEEAKEKYVEIFKQFLGPA